LTGECVGVGVSESVLHRQREEREIIKWGRFDYQWQIGWRVLAHLLAAQTERKTKQAIIKWGRFDYQWQIGWWVRAHLLAAQTERKSERQLLNEGDLIISGKLDGECAHTNLLHRQRERVSGQFIKWGRFDYQWQIGWWVRTHLLAAQTEKKSERLSNEGNLIINFTQNWLITTNVQINHSMFWNWNYSFDHAMREKNIQLRLKKLCLLLTDKLWIPVITNQLNLF
jgi:hypothetical protein